jgi:PhnB protein
MAIRQLNPYLHYDGNAADAIAHYETTLGAKVESLMRYSDAPDMDKPELANRIMHSELRVGGGLFMCGDIMPGPTLAKGSNTEIVLDFDDLDDMQQRFDALGAGGTVTMPLQDTFWGARFGTLTDRFGIQWMFNCMKK